MEKSAMLQMVEWLKGKKGFDVPMAPSGVMGLWRDDVIRKAEQLLSEEKEKAKPTAPASLAKQVLHWCDEMDEYGLHSTAKKIREEVLRYQPDESLAELADRKMGMAVVKNIYEGKEITRFAYHYDTNVSPHFYTEAEAREYLNGLPDKGEK